MKRTDSNMIIRLFDLAVAAIGIACFSSLILGSLLVSWIAFRAWPVYSAWRLGYGGIPYRHRKIRSMRVGKSLGREYWEKQRLTRWGRSIRRLHFDETLELFHILEGSMSLVGPRPLIPEHARRFPRSSIRETVPPGWAGLAQLVLFKNGILYGPQQALLDAQYVRNRSFTYNLRILAAFSRALVSKRAHRNADPRANEYRRSFGTRLR